MQAVYIIITSVTVNKHIFLLITSRLAPAEGRRSLRESRPSSFAVHTHRKHLKTCISENTLIYSGNQTNAHCHIYIFLLESNSCIFVYPCCVTIFPLDFKQHYSLKTKPSVSKNGLGRPQNDLGGCRDQAYNFQHQKLPLYAQSREPFHTGHGWPFRTNTQTNSSLLY